MLAGGEAWLRYLGGLCSLGGGGAAFFGGGGGELFGGVEEVDLFAEVAAADLFAEELAAVDLLAELAAVDLWDELFPVPGPALLVKLRAGLVPLDGVAWKTGLLVETAAKDWLFCSTATWRERLLPNSAGVARAARVIAVGW
jgi:hypothetical protein